MAQGESTRAWPTGGTRAWHTGGQRGPEGPCPNRARGAHKGPGGPTGVFRSPGGPKRAQWGQQGTSFGSPGGAVSLLYEHDRGNSKPHPLIHIYIYIYICIHIYIYIYITLYIHRCIYAYIVYEADPIRYACISMVLSYYLFVRFMFV